MATCFQRMTPSPSMMKTERRSVAAERDAVRAADTVAVVGEQREGQAVLAGELLVALDALQADAPDLGAEFLEARRSRPGSCTSARCRPCSGRAGRTRARRDARGDRDSEYSSCSNRPSTIRMPGSWNSGARSPISSAPMPLIIKADGRPRSARPVYRATPNSCGKAVDRPRVADEDRRVDDEMRDHEREHPARAGVEPAEDHPHQEVADEGAEALVQVVAAAQDGGGRR